MSLSNEQTNGFIVKSTLLTECSSKQPERMICVPSTENGSEKRFSNIPSLNKHEICQTHSSPTALQVYGLLMDGLPMKACKLNGRYTQTDCSECAESTSSSYSWEFLQDNSISDDRTDEHLCIVEQLTLTKKETRESYPGCTSHADALIKNSHIASSDAPSLPKKGGFFSRNEQLDEMVKSNGGKVLSFMDILPSKPLRLTSHNREDGARPPLKPHRLTSDSQADALQQPLQCGANTFTDNLPIKPCRSISISREDNATKPI